MYSNLKAINDLDSWAVSSQHCILEAGQRSLLNAVSGSFKSTQDCLSVCIFCKAFTHHSSDEQQDKTRKKSDSNSYHCNSHSWLKDRLSPCIRSKLFRVYTHLDVFDLIDFCGELPVRWVLRKQMLMQSLWIALPVRYKYHLLHVTSRDFRKAYHDLYTFPLHKQISDPHKKHVAL